MSLIILRRSAAVAPAGGGGNWLSNLGLLFPTGVEPVGSEMTLFPFQPGGSRRIWYVDFNAGSNGDGTVGSPYRGLTEVTANLGSGDQIWWTGDATAAKHSPGVRDMFISITSAAQIGTAAIPTVMRSWPGRSRAKFDGNYTTQVGVFFDPSVNDGTRGVAVLNTEVTRCNAAGCIVLGAGANTAGIAYQRLVGCYLHHNYSLSGGPNSNYGGAYLVAKGGVCDIQAYNCHTHDNNTSDGSTISVDNNTGGLSLLSEASAAGSTVRFFNNLLENEHFGIRHKHAGHVDFESFHNYASACDHMHYLRASTSNKVYESIFRDGAQSYSAFIVQEAENQDEARTVDLYNNTVVRVARLVSDGDTNFAFADILRGKRNIHSNPSASIEPIVLGAYSDRGYNTAGASFENNVIDVGSATTFWLNNGTTKTRAQFDAQFGAGANIYGTPMFTNAAGNDFTLQPGSPAESVNGYRAGAL